MIRGSEGSSDDVEDGSRGMCKSCRFRCTVLEFVGCSVIDTALVVMQCNK